MDRRLAWVAAAALLATAGCTGAATGSRPAESRSPAQSPTPPAPVLTVTPNSGLIGGQQLAVTVRGFPAHASVMLSECANVPPSGVPGCSGGIWGAGLFTDALGKASGVVLAQPVAETGTARPTRVVCRLQCVLVVTVVKRPPGELRSPAPQATAALSFSSAPLSGLADAFLVDLTWVSTEDGWALAEQPCTRGVCARVARTIDGGQHWQALPDPPARFADGNIDCLKTACVTNIRFATPTVGYLYGPALLMTRDGGRTWATQSGSQVETLTVVGASVYRVAYTGSGCPGPCDPSLQRTAVGSSSWQTLIGRLSSPDRSDSAEIVPSGPDLLLALYGSLAGPVSAQAVVYRSSDAGNSWRPTPDPCAGRRPAEHDLTTLAADPGGFFAAECTPHGTNTGGFLLTSTDGGSGWRLAGTLPGLAGGVLAAATVGRLAYATSATSGGGPYTSSLLVSTDGGQHWAVAARDPQQITGQVPAWLGFETAEVGRWVGDPHSVWTTRDGGAHWTRTRFQ